jgi:ABC-type sugar transport system permease subunit
MDRLISAVVSMVIAVAFSGLLWISLNLLVNQAKKDWSRFAALTGGIVAAIFFGALRGNRSITPLIADADAIAFGSGGGWLGHVEWSIVGAIIWGGGLFAISKLKDQLLVRVGIGVAMGVVSGWLIGSNVQIWLRPSPNIVSLILATIIGAAIGAGLKYRSRNFIPNAVLGAAIGWAAGAWLFSPLAWEAGSSGASETDAIISTIIPLVLLGIRFGLGKNPDIRQTAIFDARARAVIFVGPAVLFLSVALVIPALRTVYLSFLDRDGADFVGFDNYVELFESEDSFDLSNWTDIFTSQLFWIALVLTGVGAVIGLTAGHRRNGEITYERTGSSVFSIAFGVLLLMFGIFSVIRGTFFNNIWWVVTVTSMSTVLGLLIAVLSERAGRFENFAKALIFMPMAVSFVGASIVWRLQYQPRDPTSEQTGVMNAIWVGLGKLSNAGADGNTYPSASRYLVLIVLAAILAFIAYQAFGRIRGDRTFSLHVTGLIMFGYLFVELARRSLGGFTTSADGSIVPDTILFLQEPPFNNVFLMVVLIWIQTGFAMVILSAAIKSVPTEFLEAAQIDGATESQTFFNVTLPQILPTVGVVVTTLIVLVSKVFDIVKVTTGGNFDTNVLANDMYTTSFNFFNIGLGATIAVFILITVLPVMIYNIRQMQSVRN